MPRLTRLLPLAQPLTVILGDAVLSATITTMTSMTSTSLAALSLSYMPLNSPALVTFSRFPWCRPCTGFLKASLRRGAKHCTSAVLCAWLGLVIGSLLSGMSRLASTQGLFQPEAPDAPTKTCYCHRQDL